MSQGNLVQEAGGKNLPLPNPANTESAKEEALAPERKDALVNRAKDIIAGRTPPPELIAPPEVRQFLNREFGEAERKPTADALRRATEWLSLEAHYAGRPVACFTTRAGGLAVMASGEIEVEAVLRGLSDDERAKVVVIDSGRF